MFDVYALCFCLLAYLLTFLLACSAVARLWVGCRGQSWSCALSCLASAYLPAPASLLSVCSHGNLIFPPLFLLCGLVLSWESIRMLPSFFCFSFHLDWSTDIGRHLALSPLCLLLFLLLYKYDMTRNKEDERSSFTHTHTHTRFPLALFHPLSY